jgi:hypothetical protein
MAERMVRKITFIGNIKDFDAEGRTLKYWSRRPYRAKLQAVTELTAFAYQLRGEKNVLSRLRRPIKIVQQKRR